MRAACKLPIVLDAGGGWGDPVHVHRTIALAEAAGFAAIEIEDQLLPRRVEHHVGIDHLVPTEFMLRSRRGAGCPHRSRPRDYRAHQCAPRRRSRRSAAAPEAFHKAGADMIFCYTRNAEEMRKVGERLPPPLMMFAPPDGFSTFRLSQRDCAALGYRLAASSGTAFAAMYKAVRQSYLPRGGQDGPVPRSGRCGPTDESRTGHCGLIATGDRTPHHAGDVIMCACRRSLRRLRSASSPARRRRSANPPCTTSTPASRSRSSSAPVRAAVTTCRRGRGASWASTPSNPALCRAEHAGAGSLQAANYVYIRPRRTAPRWRCSSAA